MSGGVTVTVKIRDEEVWASFKRFVIAKHGKLHTALGLELTEAIRRYLREEEGAHTQNSSKKAQREVDCLKKEILKLVEPGGSLPRRMLENIVRRTSGVIDKRSVGDRIEALVAEGFLQRDWLTSTRGDVFKVVGYGAEKAR
jgi:hypothetical protein